VTDHPGFEVRDLAKLHTAAADDTFVVIGVDATSQVVLRFMPLAPTDDNVDMFMHKPTAFPRHVCLLTPDQADLLAELLVHAAKHAKGEL
jgi:hypothetical protein